MTLRRNLTMQQGATFSNTMAFLDSSGANVDVTGSTGRAMMRPHHESNTATANLTVDLSNGQITVSMTANGTANVPGGLYVYDVEVVNSTGGVIRAYDGKIRVNPEATR